MAAPGVLKGRLGCASLMGVDAVVNTTNVQRVHKGAPCFARHMVVGSAAHLQGAPKVLKEAPHCARHTVVGSVAFSMAVVFVLKVSMEVLTFVLLMVVGRGVLFQVAPKVHAAVLTVVLGMVGVNDANLKAVKRVLKEAQIFARLMVEESDAIGVMASVRNLQGEKVGSVPHTVAWYMNEK